MMRSAFLFATLAISLPAAAWDESQCTQGDTPIMEEGYGCSIHTERVIIDGREYEASILTESFEIQNDGRPVGAFYGEKGRVDAATALGWDEQATMLTMPAHD